MKQDKVVIEGDIGRRILGGVMRVHSGLGPGLLESAYEACLAYELAGEGLDVQRQVPLPVQYRDVKLDCSYRLDLVVDGLVVLELKVVDELNNVHFSQLLSYLRLGNYRLGYLLNFNVQYMKNGIKRIVN
jgi:GxxExxY protein